MGEPYPEVVQARDAAIAFLKAEEEKFRETYHTGITLLENEIAKLGDARQLSGETAFELYDSHGFPLELSEEICAEQGITVDRDGFEACMEQQRQRSREGSVIADELFVASAITADQEGRRRRRSSSATETSELEAESSTRQRRRCSTTRGRSSRAPRRSTRESGGQVGDQGVIEGPHGKFLVADTQKNEGYFVHTGRVLEGGRSPRASA